MNNKLCLLIDDDPDDREIFVDVLKEVDNQYNCQTAENGLEALKILEKSEQLPDFIFLDLNMPIMSGIQFLTEIKKNTRYDSISIVIYSTSSYQKNIIETQELGARYFLTKPYSTVSLAEAISRILLNQIFSYVVKTIE